MNDKELVPINIYNEIKQLLDTAKKTIVQNINITMVMTYYNVGRLIVESEQVGQKRAEYAKETIKELSIKLSTEFGKGFSETNLKQMRQFYITYKKRQTPSDQFRLSWSQYLIIMRIDNAKERSFYEIESSSNNWSTRELKRQVDSALYERIALSKNKKQIKELSEKGLIYSTATDAIKDPYVLEFLNLDERDYYSESDLETAIINKLEKFLIELGKGFSFVARQQRISFDEKHFYIDLVFYNRILKCFFLIDLKIGELKHQDIGQLQMYVNYYDREVKGPEENPTIGLILCRDKNNLLVEYTLPKENNQIFASKYKTVLPDKKVLRELLETNQEEAK